ncbi:hypothetical protein N0B16_12080 [Chryseobacterium sp. GMJ5]|uniref:Uncharacterized protein n=1 Tax=Chryseobacterium gilvum TaxID=2976534 RepID=A0ABT2VYV3_9FLAO|nr:hypothetical protein [Chryseobacterium gilvum]MCU7615178.1 hypothetical protein [Chryseobacterium gilvum]
MRKLNIAECRIATNAWKDSLSDYSAIKSMISPNQVFILNFDEISWLQSKNEYKEFCSDIGVYNNQVIMILCPLDKSGQKIVLEDYPYVILTVLDKDLQLFEKQQYTVVKTSVLSKELMQTNSNSDIAFPFANQPVMEQDKALTAIESWRSEGKNWFLVECNAPFNGSRIFERFYVPAEDLTFPQEGLNAIVCTFAMKYSDVYQRMLVSMIFISFYNNLGNDVTSNSFISNTYDWSRPCPPICEL